MKQLLRNVIVCGAALTASSMVAFAQYKPIEFKEYDLPNGLHVILHEDHSAPVVATVLHYKVGSRDEDPKRTGFAHFFEHLMFEGTDKIERGTVDKMVNGAGGELNAFTSQDRTVYHFVLPSNQLRLALWIEAQRMRKLNVNNIGVETQRGVVKEERKNRYDNASYGGWMEKTFAALYAGTPYAWAAIGSAQHIDSAAISEFKAFYDMYYQPNNVVLVVSGDFDEKTARETIDAYFGGYPKGPEAPRPVFTGMQTMTANVRETINDPRAQLPAIFMGYRAMSMLDEDAYAAQLLSLIMSEGESSRLYRAAVDSTQLSVEATTNTVLNEYAGMFMVIGVCAPGKDPAALEKTIVDQLEKVAAEGVTEAELAKAKNIMESGFINERTGVYDKALALSDAYRYNHNTAEVNEDIQKYMKVTTADIKRVAQKLFSGKFRSVFTYLPAKG